MKKTEVGMEDGSDGISSTEVLPSTVKNGEVMANFPDVDCNADNETKNIPTSPAKVNGDSNLELTKSEDESDSSDCDALIIDESIKPQKTKKLKSTKPKSGGFKGFKKSNITDTFVHTNPYFAESIFDLLEKSQEKKDDSNTKEGAGGGKKINCKNHTKNQTDKKTKANPKLREYAQYLGLQPTVQFKCSKCSRSGFPSLASLNEHLIQCNESIPVTDSSTINVSSSPSTNIRVTRKVFLCSACGTYYENWNLFLHMREVHKRYICLYCLGMFSHPDKLAVHIVSKHNCVPNHINTLDEFYSLHGEPCFLMCCECQRGFTERDNFFDHMCIESTKVNVVKNLNQKQGTRQNNRVPKSKNIEHVTADSIINDSDDISTDCATNDKLFAESNPTDTTVQTDNETDRTHKISRTETSSEDLISKCDTNMKNEDSVDTFLESNSSQLQDDSQKVAKEQSDSLGSNNQEAELKTSEGEQNLEEACDNLADFDDAMKKSDYDSAQSENNYSENVVATENTPATENIPAVESETKMEQSAEDETRSFEEEEMNVSDQEQSDPDILNDSFDMNILDDQEETEPSAQETKSDVEEKANQIMSGNEDENRRVPKVTLKLPKSFDGFQSDKEEDVPVYESDDSEKLTMEVDQTENTEENCTENDDEAPPSGHGDLQVAGPDVSIVDLELEQPLDKFDIKFLLQKCLRSTVPTCVYCNHARRICVNGKQLGLHAIAEHRFSAIVNSITAEELIPESFVARIKDGFPELENVYFNLESNTSEEAITFSHIFECFQCRYSTMVHKELYLHNRKMHAKSILLCIMCKSNFYSYSELICHLCPGLYELDKDVHFRCCMCVSDELPSAFRLMVHLRKKHHACDVCLELCHNQSRLSNHVWKHKLHHLCYRCGIAYRNKPDITKHLFWKHGTESVLCKKCLQKKWPHVYHFCIPPTTFSCEECNLSFTRAVSVMVHKRLHANDKPHACTEENCTERFISKKLLLKHEFKHREPTEEAAKPEAEKAQESENLEAAVPVENAEEENVSKEANEVDDKSEKTKPKVDVYDLPELNLSESDSSDTEDEMQKNSGETTANTAGAAGSSNQSDLKDWTDLESEKPVAVLETIWDDFRNYQANKEKLQNNSVDPGDIKETPSEEIPSLDVILKDHDYCVLTNTDNETASGSNLEKVEMSVDHDYCFGGPSKEAKKTDVISKKKANGSSSSNSSSDSDSSSCTCGSNCSCSSSSGSSSSSSDSSESDSSTSEGRRRQQQRRERRKQKSKSKKVSETATVDVVATDNQAVTFEVPIQESDLETTESDTDEDFYDKQPQKLASKLLAEKKNQLLQMAAIGPYINGSIMDGSRPPTPSLPEEAKPKKKSKSKKRKKKNKSSKYEFENPNTNIPVESYPLVSPLTLTLPKNSPVTTPLYNSPNSSNVLLPNINLPTISQSLSSLSENDSSLRASKRRRVPNKFYGYSSDEEQDKIPQPPVYKWRKVDLPSPKSPLVVPPITIKTVQAPSPTVDPISIRSTVTSGELRVQQSRPHLPPIPKMRTMVPQVQQEIESGTDSNDSSSEEDQPPPKEQPALYCYCRCPYDEVSEMIGCDASDCAIEWFHFECVGIMVPPKGQWFCPDCRKKKQQRREMFQNQL